jgi:hypothetical protein
MFVLGFTAIVARAPVFGLMVGAGIATWLGARRRLPLAHPGRKVGRQARDAAEPTKANRGVYRRFSRNNAVCRFAQSEQFCTDCAPR